MFPYYKQYDSMDCGPTCLRMVAKYYKRSIPAQSLREKTQIGKEGVNLLGISEAAEAIGFKTKAVRIDTITLIKDVKLPAILHWNQNHFVVLYRVKRNKAMVADPAKGLINYTIKELEECWASDKSGGLNKGIALLLEPSKSFYEVEFAKEEKGLHFNNILNYIRPYKKLVYQLFLGLGVSSLLQLILPFLTQSVVDSGIDTANIHFVYIVLLAQLALFAGRLAVEFVRSWILLHISTRINLSILTDFLIKLMKLPLAFFDSKHTGDILQRMNDHSRIESFLTGSSLNTLFSLINLVVFSIVLAVFNVSIFIVFLLASILYAVWVLLFLKKRKVLDYKRFEIQAKEQSATIQLVQGMQEIKLNGIEKPMRWAWEGLQASLFTLSMRGLSLNQWQQAGAFFVNEGKNIIITFLAAKAVIDGQMTIGSMLAVQYIIGQLNSPVEQMIGFAQSWQNAKISMDRLNEIHRMEDEEPEDREFQYQLPKMFLNKVAGGAVDLSLPLYSSGFRPSSPEDKESATIFFNEQKNVTQPLLFEDADSSFDSLNKERINDSSLFLSQDSLGAKSGEHALSFCNVSFTYPGAGNEPVLKDINLSIPIGKTTAIVGTSGSGKTTLLKLLLKIYNPQKGDITLDNTSLSNISHKYWRSQCSVVMQESYIFSNTIARNIALGTERVDMERLYGAAEVANILEFIQSLPLGFNTQVGSDGIGISAGQKQRILVARAVYRNPEFIFFDEATNSLDANNESIIIKNLNLFFEGRTVVVVAHRLSTVKGADQIVVLNNGVIAERGTHSELVNQKGKYYHLVKNQLELGN